MRGLFRALPLLLVACLPACEEMPPPPGPPVEEAVTPSSDDPMVQAPPGGYADWLGDIRTALQMVLPQASDDRGVALNAIRQVYESRFVFLRQYFGTNGSANAGAALAQSIEQLGMHMQQLMLHLTTDEVTVERIREEVAATDSAITRVEAEARAVGLPPRAPRR